MGHPFDMQRRTHLIILRLIALGCLGLLAACGPSHSAQQTGAKGENANVKRYQLTGRVVSVDKATQSVNVDGDEIPGFMAAMAMPYPVKDAAALEKLSPGDRIKAEIVLGNEGAYLENITLAQKAPSPNPTK
ncbi:MAG TPA: copper-binding protein [Terriglobales bacterium]|nr:copper-binding protein [Terriglobales bacterium]